MIEPFLLVGGLTLLIMITPGADMVLVMRHTLLSGRAAGGAAAAGVLAGNLLHMTYSAAGVGWLLNKSPAGLLVLKLAGGSYLVYLGIRSWRTAAAPLEPGPDHALLAAPAISRQFLQGLANNLLNPKGPLFYISLFTVVITPDMPALITALLVAETFSISALFWLLFILTLGDSRVRGALAGRAQITTRLFGAVLIGLGARLLLSAL